VDEPKSRWSGTGLRACVDCTSWRAVKINGIGAIKCADTPNKLEEPVIVLIEPDVGDGVRCIGGTRAHVSDPSSPGSRTDAIER